MKFEQFLVLVLFLFFGQITTAQGNKAHYIEANRLASEGQIATAFQLIQAEAEKDLDCAAIGYYWVWALQYGTAQNDSTFIFNQAITNTAVSQSFAYTFKPQLLLNSQKNKCRNNGVYNKAQGMYWWKKAKLASTFDLESENIDKSVTYFQSALQSGAYDTTTTFYLAEGLLRQYKYGEAIRYYKRTYELDDSHTFSLVKIAAASGKLEEWDSCLKYAEITLQLSNSNYEKSIAYRLKAEALASKNQRKLACKNYEKSLSLFPDDIDNNLSFIKYLYANKKKKGVKKAIDFMVKYPLDKNIHASYNVYLTFIDKENIYNAVLKKLVQGSSEFNFVKSNL